MVKQNLKLIKVLDKTISYRVIYWKIHKNRNRDLIHKN